MIKLTKGSQKLKENRIFFLQAQESIFQTILALLCATEFF